MDSKTFEERVAQRSHTIAIVGLGYVGLPLAVAFAEAGYPTLGFDVARPVIEGLNSGVSHIDDVASERVASIARSGLFRASTDATVLAEASVVFICVPTPFDKAKTPDLSYIQAATEFVANQLVKGTLVVLQSTTYPGTTTDFVKPILERGGLKAGIDFHLAFSPERVDPGNTQWGIGNTPKVVGGFTEECTRRSVQVLETLMMNSNLVHAVKSPAIAEMCKLLENTYRAVNIAFVNELAQICHEMQIDVWDVINAASTKPFGFQAFYPGIGPGGHCIPVDPHYLAWKAREYEFNTRFIELAADINSQMANYVVWRIQDMLNRSGKSLNGATVLCLGAAFKAGVSDVRNSRAIHVMELLWKQGAQILYCDPHVPTVRVGSSVLHSLDLGNLARNKFDAVAVLVGSSSWPIVELEKTEKPIFDAVNAGGSPTGARERL